MPSTSGSSKKGPFHRPPVEKEEIPTPEMFLEVLKSQWDKTGSFSNLGGNERRFYNLNPTFAQALQLLEVDTPVATLTSASTVVTGDIANCLKAEDKKAETILRKTFQAITWAIRAAASASCFNRSTMLWLEQLRDRTLATAASRRLLWLRHWQAESRAKWHLAGADYAGDKRFGALLDPILVEDKNKWKVFPATTRRSNYQHASYPRRTSYRPPESDAQNHRPKQPLDPGSGHQQHFLNDLSQDEQLVAGVVLIITGVCFQVKLHNAFLVLNEAASGVAVTITVIGALIIILSGFGAIALFSSNKAMIKLFTGLLVLLLITEILIVATAYACRLKLHQTISKDFMRILNKYDNKVQITKGVDTLQAEFQCCGVENYTDWQNTTFGLLSSSVPKSCCKVPMESCVTDLNQNIVGINQEVTGIMLCYILLKVTNEDYDIIEQA
ncbi:PREDICTED: uncharacterized protein LOC106540994 [Thamnophis sirtalis]|uniref:Uncharacterized protein LOC106540994 n=1 Tax=Thamnophis sirtalis TaxID=35019 RepID=A0A6I9XLS8_9SAUR|nr:PREDICTED: uncharacterized protein LOC106540994 [Thamnophis sirtalis]